MGMWTKILAIKKGLQCASPMVKPSASKLLDYYYYTLKQLFCQLFKKKLYNQNLILLFFNC